MPPGRKVPAASTRNLAEVPLTEYEKARAQTMMRNNQVLQRLGVTALASILNSSSANGKGSAREGTSGSYEPGHSEDDEEGTIDKVSENVPEINLTRKTIMPTGGTRGSKRVMAIDEQSQPPRTRQRTKEVHSVEKGLQGTTSNTQEEALIAANCPSQPDDQIQICSEGQPNAMIDRWTRGRSMGKDLERMTRGLSTKIPVQVAKGKKRPDAPMQAAKLASEGGIVLRQHIPILPHWKEYKKDQSHLKNYMGKVAAQFTIDTTNKAVTYACTDLLKCGQRQLRYKLKKAYFDGVPANEVITKSPLDSMTDDQWKALVEMWSSPKHKDKCLSNKGNRGKVQFNQRTGSRCFIAHTHVMKQDKYKDVPPTAIDLFKELHCSKKTGFSESVKEAIAQIESVVNEPVEEGQVPKTPAEAIAQVLPTSKFLQSVGFESAAPKRSAKVAVAARVQELEAQVEAEKQSAAALQEKLDGQQDQIESLKKMVGETEEAREKQLEEVENLKNQADETNALLRRLFSLNKE